VEERLARGDDVLLDIDVRGAAQVRERMPSAELVFILPPDRETLVARLRGRRTESAASLERRVANAAREVRHYGEFHRVVVNDDLERATAELAAIVTAARCLVTRRDAEARRIVATFPDPGQDG